MRKLAPLLIAFSALCALTVAARAADAAPDDSFLAGAGGIKFFVGQLFTVLASAFGIYFASYVSFQRSLKHSKLVKAQQTAALLTAARQELTDNILRMREFDQRLPGEGGYPVSIEDWPRLRLFVWHAVGRSSYAFDLPPRILNGVQGFYEDLEAMLQDNAARQDFRHLTSSNIYSRTQYKERMNALLSGVETAILPDLDKTVTQALKTAGQLAG